MARGHGRSTTCPPPLYLYPKHEAAGPTAREANRCGPRTQKKTLPLLYPHNDPSGMHLPPICCASSPTDFYLPALYIASHLLCNLFSAVMLGNLHSRSHHEEARRFSKVSRMSPPKPPAGQSALDLIACRSGGTSQSFFFSAATSCHTAQGDPAAMALTVTMQGVRQDADTGRRSCPLTDSAAPGILTWLCKRCDWCWRSGLPCWTRLNAAS